MSNPINYWYQKYQSLKAEMDKMMKGVVEAAIYQVSATESRIWYPLDVKQYKDGDKVRVIIVKEDTK